MDKRKSNPGAKTTVTLKPSMTAMTGVVNATQTDPNELLNTFLNENNLVLTTSAISDNNSYIQGKGFVLTKSPLLVVGAEYKS